MSDDSGGGGEKTHDPTPKKLEDARKKGDVPRSAEVSAVAAYAGLLLAVLAGGGLAAGKAGSVLTGFLAAPDRMTGLILGPGGGALSATIVLDVVIALAPFFVVPFLAVVAVLVAQGSFVVSGEKLMPKLSRISPVATAANKYGPTGLVEFAKSTAKLIAISVGAFFLLLAELETIIGTARASTQAQVGVMGDMFLKLLIGVIVIASAIALADLMWQRFDHSRKLRMSFQEIRDESKEAEGDPHMRARRRQRALEMSQNRMLADVPTADVIIVNPTHVSIALKWSRAKGSAPVCVAKGQDEMALRIREAAGAAGVPIHRDAPTARALHAVVEIGREIPQEHYRAVAAAIRFAETMRQKARARGWGPRGPT